MTLQHSAKVNGGVYNGTETYTGQEISSSPDDVTALRESDHAGSKWTNMNPLALEVSEKKPVIQVRAKTKAPSEEEEEDKEEEEEELTERERTRREKISVANTGKVYLSKSFIICRLDPRCAIFWFRSRHYSMVKCSSRQELPVAMTLSAASNEIEEHQTW
jgi:hypothetical protein